MAHRAPRPSDTGAGAGRRPREGGVTMLMGRASKTEGRKGSQRRLDEGGRYLGIPQNGGLVAPRDRHFGEYPDSGDRKSTRLNSSHPSISYAFFCLKKKYNDAAT